MPNKPAWSPQSSDLAQPVSHDQPHPLSFEQSWEQRGASYDWPPRQPSGHEVLNTRTTASAPTYYPDHLGQQPYHIKHEDQPWSPHAHSMQQIQQEVQVGGTTIPTQRPRMDTRGVDVKTKFPTARIKRIMQADEDVGKVAQVTPVVMAKALELFMIRLITSSSDVAKSRNSKRVQTAHMKAVITQDEQFDFLRDIVSKVPDAPQKKAAAAESDDSEAEAAAPKRRKKSTAAGASKSKKRRGSDDDDS